MTRTKQAASFTSALQGTNMAGIPSDFFERLRAIYERDVNLRTFWPAEEAALREILPQVAEKLPSNYEIIEPLGVGGSGVVAVTVDKNLGAKRALKLSRPSPGKEELLARVLLSETQSLLRLSHQNLIRIFAQGVVTRDGNDNPFYVMEYVEGVLDSDVYLRQTGRTQEQVLGIFAGVLSAVEYLHEQQEVHMDLKPGNVLVTPASIPIISDLGFAKQLRVDDQFTLIGGTEGYIHPEARTFVEEAKTDPNRMRGQAPRVLLKPAWDLYSLGKTFLRLLHVLDEDNPKVLSPYAKRYLKLLSCRLLDGHNSHDERSAGLSLSTFREIKYTSASQARVDLEKLSGSYNLESRIPELNPYVQDTIQVTTLSTTPFTPRIKALVSHPAMMRLGSITQLGLLNLIYPTATHTRLEHSLGTLSVLARFIVALYNDPLNPVFKQIMDEEDLKAGLLAALLHDLGQYPLAHDLEEADEHGFKHEALTIRMLETEDLGLASLVSEGNYSRSRNGGLTCGAGAAA
jgi:serine/threonine protein kinase